MGECLKSGRGTFITATHHDLSVLNWYMRETLIYKTIQSLGCGTAKNCKCQRNIIHYSLNVLEHFYLENDNALLFFKYLERI